jgi:hypothetical protein
MSKKKNKKKSTKVNKALERAKKKLETIKTQNGQLIYQLMVSRGVRGDYKDYVLVTPTEIIDWQDRWTVVSGEVFDKPQLMHKKLLRHVLGDDVASEIWHPKMGRLVAVKGR